MSDDTFRTTPRWALANPFAVPGTGRRAIVRVRLPRARLPLLRAQERHFGTRRGSGLTDGDPYWDEGLKPRHMERCWKRFRRTRWKEQRHV